MSSVISRRNKANEDHRPDHKSKKLFPARVGEDGSTPKSKAEEKYLDKSFPSLDFLTMGLLFEVSSFEMEYRNSSLQWVSYLKFLALKWNTETAALQSQWSYRSRFYIRQSYSILTTEGWCKYKRVYFYYCYLFSYMHRDKKRRGFFYHIRLSDTWLLGNVFSAIWGSVISGWEDCHLETKTGHWARKEFPSVF